MKFKLRKNIQKYLSRLPKKQRVKLRDKVLNRLKINYYSKLPVLGVAMESAGPGDFVSVSYSGAFNQPWGKALVTCKASSDIPCMAFIYANDNGTVSAFPEKFRR